MDFEVSYDILASGPSFEACCRKVEHFFAKTMLVKFDTIRIMTAQSLAGTDGAQAAYRSCSGAVLDHPGTGGERQWPGQSTSFSA